MKKHSAGFHRLRRKHFEAKNAPAESEAIEEPIELEVSPLDEPEPRKGRKPSYNRKLPWPTAEEKMHDERKRIFKEHLLFLAKRQAKEE